MEDPVTAIFGLFLKLLSVGAGAFVGAGAGEVASMVFNGMADDRKMKRGELQVKNDQDFRVEKAQEKMGAKVGAIFGAVIAIILLMRD